MLLTPFNKSVEYELVFRVDGPISYFTTDRLGNVYVVNDKQITKYKSYGRKMSTYNKNIYGPITFVDASNPYRILVFYSDFIRLSVLDNMLSEKSEPFDLNTYGFDQVTLVAKSYNNGIWLFDPVSQQLVRMDEQLKETLSTTRVNQFLETTIDPHFMMEANGKLYMSDDHYGILVFDIYGNYIKTIPIKGISEFQIADSKIIYYADSALHSYDQKTLEFTTTVSKLDTVQKARVEQHLLYLQTATHLDILRIK